MKENVLFFFIVTFPIISVILITIVIGCKRLEKETRSHGQKNVRNPTRNFIGLFYK